MMQEAAYTDLDKVINGEAEVPKEQPQKKRAKTAGKR